ncbi:MAG: hypothetical protein H7Z14_16475 [Anaerolineae bacterium]|nr:hypothetical protein [Phycisphaerae bacterium]
MRPDILLHALLIAIILIGGCTTSSRQNSTAAASSGFQPATQPAAAKPVLGTRPLIDFARGAGGFPLAEDALPDSRDGLVASLSGEYRARVTVAGDVTPVVATGSDYPKLESLTVDLSGSKIKSAYRPSTFKAVGRLQRRVLHVDHLSYTATPLQYVDGSTNLRITAHDVTLGLLHGRGEQAALVMTDAKDGRVNFEVPLEDLRSMFKVSAKSGGSRAGYSVSDVQMKLIAHDSRSLTCELKVRGFWVLLPTAFKLTGRIDIDDQFNAHLSNIACKGEDVGGVLLGGFIDNALKKYDGRVMPLASFPGGRIKIRDVKISVDDSLRIYAAFGA